MKCILSASLSILLIPSAYAASFPGDSANGKCLLEASRKCYQADIFKRKDRQVQSLDALKEQLVGCSHAAKKTSPRARCRTSSNT
jgi:hypothetical protein